MELKRMQVLGTGFTVCMSQELWDILSKRMQEYDDMTEHILGLFNTEPIFTRTFILIPYSTSEGLMVPFLNSMESVKVLGIFLKPDEYFSIEHHKRVPMMHDECIEGPELQEYLAKIPAGWC